jgi:hypothetical protein
VGLGAWNLAEAIAMATAMGHEDVVDFLKSRGAK